MLAFFVLTQYWRVTNRRIDRRIHVAIAKTRASIASLGVKIQLKMTFPDRKWLVFLVSAVKRIYPSSYLIPLLAADLPYPLHPCCFSTFCTMDSGEYSTIANRLQVHFEILFYYSRPGASVRCSCCSYKPVYLCSSSATNILTLTVSIRNKSSNYSKRINHLQIRSILEINYCWQKNQLWRCIHIPVPQHVQFKLCLRTYKVLHGLATRGDLVVSSSVTHVGTRTFAVAGPKAWNQLPMHIWARESVGSFKTALKSHFHFVN